MVIDIWGSLARERCWELSYRVLSPSARFRIKKSALVISWPKSREEQSSSKCMFWRLHELTCARWLTQRVSIQQVFPLSLPPSALAGVCPSSVPSFYCLFIGPIHLAHSHLSSFSRITASVLGSISQPLAGPDSSQYLQVPQAWERQVGRNVLCPWLSY